MEPWLSIWRASSTFHTIQYLFLSGLTFLVAAVLVRVWCKREKIQHVAIGPAQVRHELLHSISSCVLFGFCGIIFWAGFELGVIKLYSDLFDYGSYYLAISFALVLAAHDSYFYWTHRLFHLKPFLRYVHKTHHRSRSPTAFASLSFGPLEALVHGFFPVLYCLVFPTHLAVLGWAIFAMVLRSAIGHSGVEFFPSWWTRTRPFMWFTTCTHHDLHHSNGRYNFGLYFTLWDRVCGTEHPEYKEAFYTACRRSAAEN